MYCPKCGSDLRPGASFCDKCGFDLKKKNVSSNKGILAGILVCLVIIVLLLCVVIFSKYINKRESNEQITSTDKISSTEEIGDKNTVFDEVSDNKDIDLFKGTSNELELPSLESFSKGRMTLISYEYSDKYKCYIATFDAGEDTSVIQCIAEYRDLLTSYDVYVGNTLSNNDGTYNYTAYPCSYNGDADIETDTVNFDNSGNCTICFVMATGNGEAFIKAYVPEGVVFTETSDTMKNSY